MKHFYIVFKKLIAVMVILAFLLTGCGQKNAKTEPKEMTSEQSGDSEGSSDSTPEQLTGIESGVENIIKALNGPSVQMEESGKEKESAGNKEGQGEKSQSGQKEGSQKESSQKEGSQTEGGGKDNKDNKNNKDNKEDTKSSKDSMGSDSSDKGSKDSQSGAGGKKEQLTNEQKTTGNEQQDPWTKITPIVNKLHYQWNDLMPQVVKQGAGKQLVDNFSNALNSLTNTVIGKNSTNTLLAASYLYSYIPDLYSLYKPKISPEIKRIRHYVRNSMLNAMTANWTQADTDINNLKSSWDIYKNTIPKDQQENRGKCDFSLMEFEKSIKEKSQTLSDIKGRVILSNIAQLEKGLKEGEKNQGEKSQGKKESSQ